jgi:Putative peptidoglycan binding domain
MPTATLSPATVRAVQILLTAQGFPLQMDGVLGAETRRALKEFQRRRQLPRTGELDAATLAALGLPVPGTPERAKDVSNADRERIAAYAEVVIDRRHAVIDRTREALNLFALTMGTASLGDTQPDLRSAIFKAAVDAAIDALKEALDDQVIGFALTFVIESVEGIQAELERAATASADRSVAEFVRAGILALDAERDRVREPALVDVLALMARQSADSRRFVDNLAAAVPALQAAPRPSLVLLELRCYEGWINAHFNGFREDGRGVIAYRVGFDGEFDVEACAVETPHGDRVGDRLNALFETRPVARVDRPIQLRVRKRACITIRNKAGLPLERGCGWLTPANTVERQPATPGTRKAFADPVWRIAAGRFRR